MAAPRSSPAGFQICTPPPLLNRSVPPHLPPCPEKTPGQTAGFWRHDARITLRPGDRRWRRLRASKRKSLARRLPAIDQRITDRPRLKAISANRRVSKKVFPISRAFFLFPRPTKKYSWKTRARFFSLERRSRRWGLQGFDHPLPCK